MSVEQSDLMHDFRVCNCILAVPPENYKGTIADWIEALIRRGLMEEGQYYGDVLIDKQAYVEVLQACETPKGVNHYGD